ncbi:hypothetical protein H6G89_14685 [Oscillatoria sp. FACHB-1407]|uniref:hypothetical protein n=1 Tax=Oscillatoria sp. FACHB-1407 TaxID=2692847 RepID=UPI001685D435|nr:hypothetical protein [Oscillatoria sp. FACHB-1407]MBD2462292.1 hypothetical protein [Oscillatoria sp. FACHB-1407]
MCNFNRPKADWQCQQCFSYRPETEHYGICTAQVVSDRNGYGEPKPFNPPVFANQKACFRFSHNQ